MDLSDIGQRIWLDLMARPDGPFGFRFIVQPIVASLLAIRDGVRDGQTSRQTFLLALVTGSSDRAALMRDAFGTVGRLMVVAIVLDCSYQLIALHALYPGEVLIVALVFGFLPYAIARGVVSRIVRLAQKRKQ